MGKKKNLIAMTIHKEGYTSIALCVLFIFVINALVHYFAPGNRVLEWLVYVVSAFLFIAIVQFFRSPRRIVNPDQDIVLAPADGKVVVIEEISEPEYFKDKRLQISIFMSPINVHSNRNPISGVVDYFKYHPGKYLMAWNPKSSTENERTTFVVRNERSTVLIRQIAGAMARRIVWYVKEDQEVVQGEEFGFIKFGSRVDVFLPLGTEVCVKLGEKVTAGESRIATFKQKG